MGIDAGHRLLHYRLVEKIGEGGMGVVWKALDTTLDREVALKILPDQLARSPDRMQRFEREAKLLATMSHPNIATIHGLHEAVGRRFLAMEYVPGQTLAQRLQGGVLGVEEALSVFEQVASALEATHRRAIIHRDLKPANIQLTPDGTVKVLDFGLAKAIAGPPSSDACEMAATVTSAPTQGGMILGTAAYMSPEQARGKPVDARTDIWAFGCALYEALSGRRAFCGDTAPDLLVAVLTREPDWEALPADLPPAVVDLLRSCLHKQAGRRLHDIAEARSAFAANWPTRTTRSVSISSGSNETGRRPATTSNGR